MKDNFVLNSKSSTTGGTNLPDQAGNGNKYLKTDGREPYWDDVGDSNPSPNEIPISRVDNTLDPGWLPKASKDLYGVMKAGTGIAVSDGVISADFGEGSESIVVGDDPRLSDTRIPKPHTSEDDTFGISTDAVYGHAKASGTLPKVAETTPELGAEISSFARGDHVHPKQTTVTGNAGTATKLKTARTISLSGDVEGSFSFDGSENVEFQTQIPGIDASQIVSGTISIDRIPHGALERLIIVEDDQARFALTQNQVQNGDTVKVNESGYVYFVIDDTSLNTEDGYCLYTSGGATSIPWEGITGKPDKFTPVPHSSMGNAYGASSDVEFGHAKASGTLPKEHDVAYVGSETSTFARGDHVHPRQTTVENAINAEKADIANQALVAETAKIADVAKNVDTTISFSLSGDVSGDISFKNTEPKQTFDIDVVNDSHTHSEDTIEHVYADRLIGPVNTSQFAPTVVEFIREIQTIPKYSSQTIYCKENTSLYYVISPDIPSGTVYLGKTGVEAFFSPSPRAIPISNETGNIDLWVSVATKNTLGLVSIGNGLSIDSGVVSISSDFESSLVKTNDSRLSDPRTPTSHESLTSEFGAATSEKFGHVQLSDALPESTGTASPGISSKVAREDHVHPAPENAGVADSLKVARKITLSGDATGEVLFDGSSDVIMDVLVKKSSIELDNPISEQNSIRAFSVVNDESRYAINPEEVKPGDIIRVAETKSVYAVSDINNLDNDFGYVLCGCESPEWSKIRGIPEDIYNKKHADSHISGDDQIGTKEPKPSSIPVSDEKGTLDSWVSKATENSLGLVKVGSGLEISSDGTLSTIQKEQTLEMEFLKEYALSDHTHPEQTNISGNAGSASKLERPVRILVTGDIESAGVFDGSADITLNTTLRKLPESITLDASKITGTISIDNLPKGYIERIHTVSNDSERFSLGKDQVQKGDIVKISETGKMYVILDNDNLSEESSYSEFTSGVASSVDWSGVMNKPETYSPESHAVSHKYLGSDPIGSVTPGKNEIPVSDMNGKLDSWISKTSSRNFGVMMPGKGLVSNDGVVSINSSDIPLPAHSSSTEEYGVATGSRWGHVRLSDSIPQSQGFATPGSSRDVSRADHIHPEQEKTQALKIPRKISLVGDITSETYFDGTKDVSIPVSLKIDASRITTGSIVEERLPASYLDMKKKFTNVSSSLEKIQNNMDSFILNAQDALKKSSESSSLLKELQPEFLDIQESFKSVSKSVSVLSQSVEEMEKVTFPATEKYFGVVKASDTIQSIDGKLVTSPVRKGSALFSESAPSSEYKELPETRIVPDFDAPVVKISDCPSGTIQSFLNEVWAGNQVKYSSFGTWRKPFGKLTGQVYTNTYTKETLLSTETGIYSYSRMSEPKKICSETGRIKAITHDKIFFGNHVFVDGKVQTFVEFDLFDEYRMVFWKVSPNNLEYSQDGKSWTIFNPCIIKNIQITERYLIISEDVAGTYILKLYDFWKNEWKTLDVSSSPHDEISVLGNTIAAINSSDGCRMFTSGRVIQVPGMKHVSNDGNVFYFSDEKSLFKNSVKELHLYMFI